MRGQDGELLMVRFHPALKVVDSTHEYRFGEDLKSDKIRYRLPPSIANALDEFLKMPSIPSRILLDSKYVWDREKDHVALFDALAKIQC